MKIKIFLNVEKWDCCGEIRIRNSDNMKIGYCLYSDYIDMNIFSETLISDDENEKKTFVDFVETWDFFDQNFFVKDETSEEFLYEEHLKCFDLRTWLLAKMKEYGISK